MNFLLVKVKIELEKMSGIKPFFVDVLGYHEFCILETILVLEINSILHFLEFASHLTTKIKLGSVFLRLDSALKKLGK